MKTLITLIALTCFAFVGSAAATQLMDDWNADQPPQSGSIFGWPANYAIQYTPAEDYELELVEFYAGASEYADPDEFTVQIMGEFDGQPDGVAQASATHPMVNGEPAGFQGTAFDEPIFMIGGQTYWVIYFAQHSSHYSAAVAGVELTTMFSGDQIHWDPANPVRWMAKFWGEPVGVAVESTTLTGVKSLFQ